MLGGGGVSAYGLEGQTSGGGGGRGEENVMRGSTLVAGGGGPLAPHGPGGHEEQAMAWLSRL